MYEKRLALFLTLVLSLTFFSVSISAQDILGEVGEEYGDIDLVSGGLTPESNFYFIDEFFDRFGDDVKIKEEKFAEYLKLKEEGNLEDANKSLEKYNSYANKLEKEIEPGKRDEARRSAAAIKNALKGSEEKYEDILKKEERIVAAVEIAGKIRTLCLDLAKLDPNAYYDNCKTEDDGPDWQKKLDKDLTAEQEKTAKNFIGIMKQCFKTSGQKCNCENIPFPDFADACSEAAILATSCDIDGNLESCDELDALEMPELPPYLQQIFEEMDEGMSEAKYEMHMPFECVDAGITDPKECGILMITKFSPPECRDALLAADVQNEWEGRKICDEIMMNIHSPECIEEGITEPRECEKFMYDIGNRPPECQENNIHDLRDCKKFLEEGGDFRPSPIQMDCRTIEDPLERLDCFDNVVSGVGMQLDEFRKDQRFRTSEDKCMEECVGPNVICRPSPTGEENPDCKECAEKCSGFYEGPCLTDKDWQEKKSECREKFGDSAGDEPIMGDSGMGYECTVDIRCVDFSQKFEEGEEFKKEFDIFEGCGAIDCQRGYHCEYGRCVHDAEYDASKDIECGEGSHVECSIDDCYCVEDQREEEPRYEEEVRAEEEVSQEEPTPEEEPEEELLEETPEEKSAPEEEVNSAN